MGLGQLDAVQIAALEMASHEEAQRRRAFEGELSQLENAWPEAEEIAAIADNPSVEEWNERQRVRLRSRGAGPAGPVG